MTDGIQCGDEVEFTGEMLSALLSPAFWPDLRRAAKPAARPGRKGRLVLERGVYADALDTEKMGFTPPPSLARCCTPARPSAACRRGAFTHKIFVPFPCWAATR